MTLEEIKRNAPYEAMFYCFIDDDVYYLKWCNKEKMYMHYSRFGSGWIPTKIEGLKLTSLT